MDYICIDDSGDIFIVGQSYLLDDGTDSSNIEVKYNENTANFKLDESTAMWY